MRLRNRPSLKNFTLFVLCFIILIVAAFHLDQYRKIPLKRAVSPTYWVQHLLGEDRYHPDTGLLQHGDPNVKQVAITIDDGPDPVYGPEIAKILKQDHVTATFFLIGIRIKDYPQVAKLIAKDGFEIGNHTYDHKRLAALKPHEIAQELRLCDRWVYKETGKHTTLMRPPGVQYNDKVLHVAKALGYVTVSWTVGASDYLPHPPSWITQRILDRTENGSIIILHQDSPDTVAALPAIISGLRAQGYQFVTVSQMLAQLHAKLPPRPAA